jgi:hypothetical protein
MKNIEILENTLKFIAKKLNSVPKIKFSAKNENSVPNSNSVPKKEYVASAQTKVTLT